MHYFIYQSDGGANADWKMGRGQKVHSVDSEVFSVADSFRAIAEPGMLNFSKCQNLPGDVELFRTSLMPRQA